MTEKRVPPWERAQLNFKLAERKRLRQLEERESPAKARLSDLEENRKRLAKITQYICPDCRRYILSELLSEDERKVGKQLGFCQCKKEPDK